MKIIVNSINTLSAGTKSVLLNILKDVQSIDGVVFVPDTINSKGSLKSVPFSTGKLKYVLRLLFELYFSLYSYLVKPSSTVVMANYSPLPVRGKKIVLVRNPYLVDEKAKEELTSKVDILIDKLRDFVFKLTLLTTDTLFLQSDYMLKGIQSKYYIPDTLTLKILPNPVSYELGEWIQRDKIQSKDKLFIYPSRFYPHKNHEFIIAFCEENNVFLSDNNIRIVVTLEPICSTSKLLVERCSSIDSIINIGEVPQTEIFNYYLRSSALLFPSSSETFGNSLIEAQHFRLPIIVNDLPYARAVCHESTHFIPMRDFRDFDELRNVMHQLAHGENVTSDGTDEELEPLYPNEWFNQLIRG